MSNDEVVGDESENDEVSVVFEGEDSLPSTTKEESEKETPEAT